MIMSAASHRSFKDRLYALYARIGKALASPKRLEILDLLAQGEKTVEAVAAQARLGVKNASAQLRELRNARLVEARKASPYVFYRLAGDEVHRLLREMQAVGRQRLAEIEQVTRLFLSGRDDELFVKVLDFGIAKRIASAATDGMTLSGVIITRKAS